MVDRDDEGTPASLELPKLSLRRRRRDKQPQPVPVPAQEPQPVEEPTTELPAATEPTVPLSPVAEPEPQPEPALVQAEPEPEPESQPAAVEEAPRRRRRERRPLRMPQVSGWPVVLATGLVVGAVLVGLTWASLQACKSVQGTTSCGKTGYPMIGLILVVAVLVGGALLRLGGVTDPVSTSILGVGLTAVLVLLFLVDHLDQLAGALAVPLISVATFAGAYALTTQVIEPARD